MKHHFSSASLSDLKVIVPDQENIQPENYLELLNSNLVYLCHKEHAQDAQIICFGIGKLFSSRNVLSPNAISIH